MLLVWCLFQHVLEKGTREQKSRIIELLKGRVVSLSMHKYASNVVEKAVSNGTTQERQELTNEVLVDNGQQQQPQTSNPTDSNESSNGDKPPSSGDNSVLWTMMKDQFANYVIQKMFEEADAKLRREMVKRINPYLNSLRQFNYAKHIVSKVEKYNQRTLGNSAPLDETPSGVNPDAVNEDESAEVAEQNSQESPQKGSSESVAETP